MQFNSLEIDKKEILKQKVINTTFWITTKQYYGNFDASMTPTLHMNDVTI